MKKLTFLLIFVSLVCAALAAAGGIYGLGLAALPAAAGVIFFAAAVAGQIISKRAPRFYRIASIIVAVPVCAAIIICGVASAQILSRYNDDAAPEGAAVIVLGCGLSQADQTSPSVMLYGRLRAAEACMRENQDAYVILSGGQGANEKISEAEAMYRYLDSRGLDMSRVYKEDRSSNTAENLSFSVALAKEHDIDLSRGVVIVTDGFHQYRAHRLAHDLGLEAYTAAADAPAALQAFYWAREIPGIVTQVWI